MLGLNKWRIKGEVPLPLKLTFIVLLVNFAVSFLLIITVPKWGHHVPDFTHNYLLIFRGGNIYFVQRWLGTYLRTALWGHFILLGILGVIAFFYRDRFERAS